MSSEFMMASHSSEWSKMLDKKHNDFTRGFPSFRSSTHIDRLNPSILLAKHRSLVMINLAEDDDDDDIVVVKNGHSKAAQARKTREEKTTTKLVAPLPRIYHPALSGSALEPFANGGSDCRNAPAMKIEASDAEPQDFQYKFLSSSSPASAFGRSRFDQGTLLKVEVTDEQMALPPIKFGEDGYYQRVGLFEQVDDEEDDNESRDTTKSEEEDDEEVEDLEQDQGDEEDAVEYGEIAVHNEDGTTDHSSDGSESDDAGQRDNQIPRSYSRTTSIIPYSFKCLPGAVQNASRTSLKRRTEGPLMSSRKKARRMHKGRGGLQRAKDWVSTMFSQTDGVLVVLDAGEVPYKIPRSFLQKNSVYFRDALESTSSEDLEVHGVPVGNTPSHNFDIAVKWMGCKNISAQDIQRSTPADTLTLILNLMILGKTLRIPGFNADLLHEFKKALIVAPSALEQSHIQTAFERLKDDVRELVVKACIKPLMEFRQDPRSHHHLPLFAPSNISAAHRAAYCGPGFKFHNLMKLFPDFELRLLRAENAAFAGREKVCRKGANKYNMFFVDPLTMKKFEV